jgi:hypothetical protein
MPVVYGIKDTRDNTYVYIGSTKNQYHRFKSHKSYCNNPNAHNYNQFVYQFIRENGGFEYYECVVIWEIPEHANDLTKIIEQIEINRHSETIKNRSRSYRGEIDEVMIIDMIQ